MDQVLACVRGEMKCNGGRCVKNRHICDGDAGEKGNGKISRAMS